MSDIASIPSGSSAPGVHAASAVLGASRTVGRPEAAAPARGTDRAEFSEVATYLSKLRRMPVREDLIERVRQLIADGEYETPEKLDAAVEEIMKDLA